MTALIRSPSDRASQRKAVREEAFARLYAQGLGDTAMSIRVGCSPTTARDWRIKNKLPLNPPQED